MREICPHEVDQHAASVAPVCVEQLFFFQQVARKVQRRPGSAIRGRVMILEKLREERTVGAGAGHLPALDPLPERLALRKEFRVAMFSQNIKKPQNVGHVARYQAAARTAAIVRTKRPGRMKCIAVLLIGRKHAGVVQPLRQESALAGGLEQP
jgi:hypothetical protein